MLKVSLSVVKVLEFFDFHLKLLMQSSWSYIRNSSDFMEKMKRIGKILEDAILVSDDVVELYPFLPPEEGLNPFTEKLVEESSLKRTYQVSRICLENQFL